MSLITNLVNKNKSATNTTGRLIKGKLATDLVMGHVVKRLPFLARMFNSSKVKNNELARLGVAETAMLLQLQFAPDNEKLADVTSAMVEHTMADVALDSEIMKTISKELEKLGG